MKIDSFVEEITNSSTVIFTYAKDNAKEMLKQFLQDILDEHKIPGDVNDYYEITTVIQDTMLFAEHIVNAGGTFYDIEVSEIYNCKIPSSYYEALDIINNKINQMLNNGTITAEQLISKYGDHIGTDLIVKSKKTGKILNINSLLGIDEAEC